MVSPSQGDNFYRFFRSFDKNPLKLAFTGIAACDLVGKALRKVRPYEVEKGAADVVYGECLGRVIGAVEKGASVAEMVSVMEWCAERMNGVAVRREERPLVGVVGEVYIRNHEFANHNVVRRLEELGAEVDLASFVEWLYYTNVIRQQDAKRRGRYREFVENVIKDWVQHRIERRLAKPFERYFGELADRDVRHMLGLAERYIDDSFQGEAILSVGKMVELYENGAAGIVNVGPFSCMPTNVVSSVSQVVGRDCGDMPIITVHFDGQNDQTLEVRLECLVQKLVGQREKGELAGKVRGGGV